MIGYDLAFLRAVLNWATTASDDRGGVLLERNPLKGLTLPTEDSPVRSERLAFTPAKVRKRVEAIPRKDLAHLGGWKDPATILECYQKPDEATQRAALEQRQTLRASGLARR
jgi:hypothetical protein